MSKLEAALHLHCSMGDNLSTFLGMLRGILSASELEMLFLLEQMSMLSHIALRLFIDSCVATLPPKAPPNVLIDSVGKLPEPPCEPPTMK